MSELELQIESTRAKMHTDSYSMSVGELASLYEKGEMDLHPEFQRLFRWDDTQKTRFVESLLLGIPIPPIFVAQRTDGIWDVVDGVQRLSTIFQLMGLLQNEEGISQPELILQPTRHVPNLSNHTWTGQGGTTALPLPVQLSFKRTRIDVNVVLKESDESGKYELFQRLNTGGSSLTDQEVRNCIILMQDKTYYDWLFELSQTESFLKSLDLSEKNLIEQYHMELALRFLIIAKCDERELKAIPDIGEFLTERTLREITSADRKTDREVFEKSFARIAEIGSKAFHRFHPDSQAFKGGFLLSPYEVIACGVGYLAYNNKDVTAPTIERVSKEIWSDPEFIKYSGSGVRASSRIPKLVPLGRSRLG